MKPILRLATHADDEALRQLTRVTPVPGPVSVTLEREPSWHESMLAAERERTIVGDAGSRLVLCGSRIVRRAWWHGVAVETAYLGDLRLHPDSHRRSGWLLRDGYRMLMEECTRDPVPVTWSAIFEANAPARGTLSGARAGLPEYMDHGRLLCPGLFVRRNARAPGNAMGLERGRDADWDEIAGFLNKQNRNRPLAPVHSADDFRMGTKWPGLRAEDFILTRSGAELQACVAVWDVRAARQVRVQRIRGLLRFARGPLWLLNRIGGWPALPRPGEVLAAGYASCFAVRDGNVDLAAAMLRAALALAAERGMSWLFVCLHERDPLAPALRGLPGISASGRLCEVRIPSTCSSWPDAVPVIEPALL